MGKRPPCAICMGPGYGPREQLRLPFGISVWLCAEHRSPEFLTQPGGAGFRGVVIRCMERRGVHDGRAAPPAAWATSAASRRQGPRRGRGRTRGRELRREAEARWARGEAAAPVIAELRTPPRPRRRDGAQRPDDAALVRGGALAHRWARRVRSGSHTCGGRRPVRGTGGRGRRRPYRDRAGRDRRSRDTEVRTMKRRMRESAGSRTTQRGVTFVEVLVVTIIVGLLAAHPGPDGPRPAGEGPGRRRAVAAALRGQRDRVGVGRRRATPAITTAKLARGRAEHRLADGRRAPRPAPTRSP